MTRIDAVEGGEGYFEVDSPDDVPVVDVLGEGLPIGDVPDQVASSNRTSSQNPAQGLIGGGPSMAAADNDNSRICVGINDEQTISAECDNPAYDDAEDDRLGYVDLDPSDRKEEAAGDGFTASIQVVNSVVEGTDPDDVTMVDVSDTGNVEFVVKWYEWNDQAREYLAFGGNDVVSCAGARITIASVDPFSDKPYEPITFPRADSEASCKPEAEAGHLVFSIPKNDLPGFNGQLPAADGEPRQGAFLGNGLDVLFGQGYQCETCEPKGESHHFVAKEVLLATAELANPDIKAGLIAAADALDDPQESLGFGDVDAAAAFTPVFVVGNGESDAAASGDGFTASIEFQNLIEQTPVGNATVVTLDENDNVVLHVRWYEWSSDNEMYELFAGDGATCDQGRINIGSIGFAEGGMTPSAEPRKTFSVCSVVGEPGDADAVLEFTIAADELPGFNGYLPATEEIPRQGILLGNGLDVLFGLGFGEENERGESHHMLLKEALLASAQTNNDEDDLQLQIRMADGLDDQYPLSDEEGESPDAAAAFTPVIVVGNLQGDYDPFDGWVMHINVIGGQPYEPALSGNNPNQNDNEADGNYEHAIIARPNQDGAYAFWVYADKLGIPQEYSEETVIAREEQQRLVMNDELALSYSFEIHDLGSPTVPPAASYSPRDQIKRIYRCDVDCEFDGDRLLVPATELSEAVGPVVIWAFINAEGGATSSYHQAVSGYFSAVNNAFEGHRIADTMGYLATPVFLEDPQGKPTGQYGATLNGFTPVKDETQTYVLDVDKAEGGLGLVVGGAYDVWVDAPALLSDPQISFEWRAISCTGDNFNSIKPRVTIHYEDQSDPAKYGTYTAYQPIDTSRALGWMRWEMNPADVDEVAHNPEKAVRRVTIHADDTSTCAQVQVRCISVNNGVDLWHEAYDAATCSEPAGPPPLLDGSKDASYGDVPWVDDSSLELGNMPLAIYAQCTANEAYFYVDAELTNNEGLGLFRLFVLDPAYEGSSDLTEDGFAGSPYTHKINNMGEGVPYLDFVPGSDQLFQPVIPRIEAGTEPVYYGDYGGLNIGQLVRGDGEACGDGHKCAMEFVVPRRFVENGSEIHYGFESTSMDHNTSWGENANQRAVVDNWSQPGVKSPCGPPVL